MYFNGISFDYFSKETTTGGMIEVELENIAKKNSVTQQIKIDHPLQKHLDAIQSIKNKM